MYALVAQESSLPVHELQPRSRTPGFARKSNLNEASYIVDVLPECAISPLLGVCQSHVLAIIKKPNLLRDIF